MFSVKSGFGRVILLLTVFSVLLFTSIPVYAVTWDSIYNVTSYGALGDGITDDSDEIQDTIDAATAANGGTIYFPVGTYRISSALTFPENATIQFVKGAKISADAGVAVAVKSEIKAGLYQIFAGNGTVTIDYDISNDINENEAGYPQWFGAKGDGSTIDTAAFQKTIDNFKYIKVPYSKDGYVVGDINITKSVYITGEGNFSGGRTLIKAVSTTSNLFNIKSSKVKITGLEINMDNVISSSSTCFFVDSATNSYNNIYLENDSVIGAYCAFKDANGAGQINSIYLTDFICWSPRGTQIHMRDCWGFVMMTDVAIDITATVLRYPGINVNFPGIIIENNAGASLYNVDVLGGADAANKTTDADGIRIINSIAVYFTRCMVDTVAGHGFVITNSQHVYMNNVVTSLCGEEGFVFNNADECQVSMLKVQGRKALPTGSWIPANIDGIELVNGSTNNQFTTVYSFNNTGHGILLDGSSDNTIMNMTSVYNQGYGYIEWSNPNRNMVIGVRMNNNYANVIQQGANSAIVNLIRDTGVYVPSVVGTANF